jgi:cell division protein DivIC
MKSVVVPAWMLKYGRNFYILSTVVFLFWMSAFDSNDFLSQFKNWQHYKEAEAEKAYYEDKIEEVDQDRAELLADPKLIEKFAREKYLMKKPTEDLYLVVEE